MTVDGPRVLVRTDLGRSQDREALRRSRRWGGLRCWDDRAEDRWCRRRRRFVPLAHSSFLPSEPTRGPRLGRRRCRYLDRLEIGLGVSSSVVIRGCVRSRVFRVGDGVVLVYVPHKPRVPSRGSSGRLLRPVVRSEIDLARVLPEALVVGGGGRGSGRVPGLGEGLAGVVV